jgi:hypothetical protein
VRRVLEEEPVPLRFVRRFPPYHEIPERRDARTAVVALHADGWSAKAISGYLQVGSSTVYRILPELALAHERFVEDYNAQAHWAHREREDGRRSPEEVLGFASGVRHREEELRRAFFSARFVRVLDALGYTRFRNWKIYGEEALAGREAALWLAAESLTVEHGGEPLCRYEVRVEPGTGELRSVARPRLFESSHGRDRPQRRLFALDSLGEGGWLKALRLSGYAPRRPAARPQALQEVLFPFSVGWS